MKNKDLDGEYFFLRKRMFRVLRERPGLEGIGIVEWNKSTFLMSNSSKSIYEIKKFKNPDEYRLPYIKFLEMKLYKSLI